MDKFDSTNLLQDKNLLDSSNILFLPDRLKAGRGPNGRKFSFLIEKCVITNDTLLKEDMGGVLYPIAYNVP